jgi:AsmA family protein
MHKSRKTWIFLGLVTAIAAVVALFEWNWLRGPLADYLGARVGRQIGIDGDLHVELSRQPTVTADSITIANAPWSSEAVMARAQRVALRLDLQSLWDGHPAFPEIDLVQPRILLERNGAGNDNWDFGPATDARNAVRIERLKIEDGVVQFRNAETGTDVTINVTSSNALDNGAAPLQFSGSGKLRNNPFTIEGSAASLLALENQDQPYALDVSAKAGSTSARFDGTIVPARIDNVDGRLELRGRDLSQLYPIIPVPFPWTPPYALSGRLKHVDRVWTFKEFKGKVGDSDLAGSFAVDRSGPRPAVDADLVSTRLDYKDLGGLVGLPPTHEPPSARTAEQNREAAKRAESQRVLPTKPYDLERLRVVDAKVRFRGKRFISTSLPLDDLNATADLEDGVLKLEPLDFGIAGGHVVSALTLDARQNVIRTRGDVTVSDVELKQILPKLAPPNGSAGKVSGRARLSATGNSVADMLGSSNGEIALASEGGEASELAIVLTNLDLARAVPLLLGGDSNSPIRCVVGDFVADNGKLDARTLAMDTQAEKILGEGSVDFARELYDLRLKAQSKKPSVLALRGPILVDGSFKSPNIHPAGGPIAARVGASVALGVLASPFAALLPLLDVGGATDADCAALVQEARANVAARSLG